MKKKDTIESRLRRLEERRRTKLPESAGGYSAIAWEVQHISTERFAQFLLGFKKASSPEEERRVLELASWWKEHPTEECPDKYLDLPCIKRHMEKRRRAANEGV